MELVEFVKVYGEWGAYGILVLCLIYAIRYSVKKNEACNEEQKKLYSEHKDEIKEMTTQMFGVVNRNTESISEFRETLKDIAHRN